MNNTTSPDEVWQHKTYLENFVNNKFKFFTFKYTNEEIGKIELDMRKEDFVSFILIKAHKKIHLYNPAKKTQLSSWITTMAINAYIDLYRLKKNEQKHQVNLRNNTEHIIMSDITIDLDSFEEFLFDNYPELVEFYELKKLDKENKDIIFELDLSKKELKNLNKKLREIWNKFNE